MFNKSLSNSMLIALIWYLCTFISEVTIVLICTYILPVFNTTINVMKNNFILNCLIVFVALIIIKLLSKKFKLIINNLNFKIKDTVFITVVLLVALALLLYRIPLYKWKIDAEFIITMIILICFSIAGMLIFKQKNDIQKTSSMYQQVVKYSNMTNKLLEDYRIVNHEHKNQLSIIRQMIDRNNKELLDYIDELIDKRIYIKYKWISDLNNIPDEGLKGLINYKLIEAEEKNIDIIVIISKEVSKTKLNKLNTKRKDELYSIIGVYLDNAIQAASESKAKKISLEIYKDKKDVILVLGNTYKGDINLDKLDSYGYSTKGKNHGIGLHIVKRILEDNKLFTQKRTVIDNYYTQELKIHTNEIKIKTTYR